MEISEAILKLIISKTKRDILKLLLQRRKMLSELSSELDLSMPTVKEHLAALEKGNLIIRFDDGHKWKYYELTLRGKEIVSEAKEKSKITFTLMSIAPVLLILMGLFIGIIPNFAQESAGGSMMEKSIALSAGAEMMENSSLQAKTVQEANYYGIASAVFIFSGIVSGLVLIVLLKKGIVA